MLREETREAAAPATMAVEKFRLVIIIIVVILVSKGQEATESHSPG
jgi:hypothetical protein